MAIGWRRAEAVQIVLRIRGALDVADPLTHVERRSEESPCRFAVPDRKRERAELVVCPCEVAGTKEPLVE